MGDDPLFHLKMIQNDPFEARENAMYVFLREGWTMSGRLCQSCCQEQIKDTTPFVSPNFRADFVLPQPRAHPSSSIQIELPTWDAAADDLGFYTETDNFMITGSDEKKEDGDDNDDKDDDED